MAVCGYASREQYPHTACGGLEEVLVHHRPLLRYRAGIGHRAVEHLVFLSQVLVELELVEMGSAT
jgi:hypothetical protein